MRNEHACVESESCQIKICNRRDRRVPEKRQRSHHSPHLECGRGDGRLLGKRLVWDSYFCGGRLAERQRAAVLPCSLSWCFCVCKRKKSGRTSGFRIYALWNQYHGIPCSGRKYRHGLCAELIPGADWKIKLADKPEKIQILRPDGSLVGKWESKKQWQMNWNGGL